MVSDPTHSPQWDVVFIIVAYEGDRWIPQCIDSLQASTKLHCLILLIDNKDNHCLKHVPGASFSIKIIKTPHPMGFAAANNFALMSVPPNARHVCFLNQDTISQEGWIDACVAGLEADSNLGATSPVIRTYDDGDWDPGFTDIFRKQAVFPEKGLNALAKEGSNLFPVHEIPATAMVIKTEVLKTTGPFDPVFDSYYEDFDLCLRIKQQGFHLAIVPSARLQHFSCSATQSKQAQIRRARWILRNRVIYQIRENPRQRAVFFLRWMSVEACRHLIRSCLGTPSSQPFNSIIWAYFDLLKLAPRLISARNDSQHWAAFMKEINWSQFAAEPCRKI